MKTVKIEKLTDLDILSNVTRKLFDNSGSLQVAIKKLVESLSDRQRGLYWRWITIVADETGCTKVDFHNQYKENVFFNIYFVDEDNHHELRAAVNSMKAIRAKITPEEYRSIRTYIMAELSHLKATTANMADVLKQLQSDADGLGIVLPQPPGNELM